MTSSLTVTPNAGSPVIATAQLVQTTSTNPYLAAFTADVPTGTTATFNFALVGTIFFNPEVHVWSVPATNVSSCTPGASVKNQLASNTVISTTIATTSGGFVVAAGICVNTSDTCTVSGTETYIKRADTSVSGGDHVAADASNVATNASSAVTMTFSPTAAIIGLIAISFR